jgi:hypothetical protein
MDVSISVSPSAATTSARMSSIADTQARHRTATNPIGPFEADRPAMAISGKGVSVEQRRQRGGFVDVAAAMIVFIAAASSLPGRKSPRSSSLWLKNFKTTGSRGRRPIASPTVRALSRAVELVISFQLRH